MKILDKNVSEKTIILKSFTGFDPEHWGVVNFHNMPAFLNQIKPDRQKNTSILIAIYLVKDENKLSYQDKPNAGKIVGFYEIKNLEPFDISKLCEPFIDTKQYLGSNLLSLDQELKKDIQNGKYVPFLEAARAWRVTSGNELSVDELKEYYASDGLIITSQGLKLKSEESKKKLMEICVSELAVYPKTASNFTITPPKSLEEFL